MTGMSVVPSIRTSFLRLQEGYPSLIHYPCELRFERVKKHNPEITLVKKPSNKTIRRKVTLEKNEQFKVSHAHQKEFNTLR